MLGPNLIPLATVGQTLGAIVGMVVLFGVAVAIHELGHLMWAKAFGVGAEEFAIGFGKRLWSAKWGGTIYSVRMLPLGGFVKIKGMVGALEEAEQSEDEGEGEKPEERSSLVKDAVYESALAMKDLALWKKILVFSGGVINNIILALILFFVLALLVGIPDYPPIPATVGWVDSASPVAEAGLRRGDHILAVDGRAVSEEARDRGHEDSAFYVMREMILEAEGEPVTLTVLRDQATAEIVWPSPPEKAEEFALTLQDETPAMIAMLVPHRPAERAGLAEGDLVVAVDGVAVDHWMDIQPPLVAADGATVEIIVDRGGERLAFTLAAEHKDYIAEAAGGRWTIGFEPGRPITELDWKRLEPVEAAVFSAGRITYITVEMFRFLGRAVTLQASGQEIRDNLGGPVMIFNIMYRSARKGLSDLLYFAAVLNVILAVMNILPYPILDGGHIVFNIVESIRGKPLSLRTLERVYGGAFTLLLVFVAWVTLKDVFTIFG